MNNKELMIVLILGTVLMCIPIMMQMNNYQIPKWKSLFVSVMLVFTGLIGSRFWYYVENGTNIGRSFYGVVFIAPFVFGPVAKVLRITYGHMMDLLAPAGCLTLALVKIQCLRDGCCDGKPLYIDKNRNYVKFPSQIAEMVTFLVIFILLMVIGKKKSMQKKIYPTFLVLYGGSRFVLNFFRDGIVPYALGLSAGSFWSLISTIVGAVALIICTRLDKVKTREVLPYAIKASTRQ